MNFAEQLLNRLGALGSVGIFASFVLGQCVYFVDGGQRALVFDRFKGVREQVHGEGMHFVLPALQWPIIIDVRTTPKTINTKTGTKDL